MAMHTRLRAWMDGWADGSMHGWRCRRGVVQDVFLSTRAQIFGAKTRSGPPGIVSLTIGKTMIPLFEHNVCNEIAMPGIGAHKNDSLAAMWLELLVFVH